MDSREVSDIVNIIKKDKYMLRELSNALLPYMEMDLTNLDQSEDIMELGFKFDDLDDELRSVKETLRGV